MSICLIPIALRNDVQRTTDNRVVWGVLRQTMKDSVLKEEAFANVHLHIDYKVESGDVVVNTITVMWSHNLSGKISIDTLQGLVPVAPFKEIKQGNPIVELPQQLLAKNGMVDIVTYAYQYDLSGIYDKQKIFLVYELLDYFLNPKSCHGVLEYSKLKLKDFSSTLDSDIALLEGKTKHGITLVGIAPFINQLINATPPRDRDSDRFLRLIKTIAEKIKYTFEGCWIDPSNHNLGTAWSNYFDFLSQWILPSPASVSVSAASSVKTRIVTPVPPVLPVVSSPVPVAAMAAAAASPCQLTSAGSSTSWLGRLFNKGQSTSTLAPIRVVAPTNFLERALTILNSYAQKPTPRDPDQPELFWREKLCLRFFVAYLIHEKGKLNEVFSAFASSIYCKLLPVDGHRPHDFPIKDFSNGLKKNSEFKQWFDEGMVKAVQTVALAAPIDVNPYLTIDPERINPSPFCEIYRRYVLCPAITISPEINCLMCGKTGNQEALPSFKPCVCDFGIQQLLIKAIAIAHVSGISFPPPPTSLPPEVRRQREKLPTPPVAAAFAAARFVPIPQEYDQHGDSSNHYQALTQVRQRQSSPSVAPDRNSPVYGDADSVFGARTAGQFLESSRLQGFQPYAAIASRTSPLTVESSAVGSDAFELYTSVAKPKPASPVPQRMAILTPIENLKVQLNQYSEYWIIIMLSALICEVLFKDRIDELLKETLQRLLVQYVVLPGQPYSAIYNSFSAQHQLLAAIPNRCLALLNNNTDDDVYKSLRSLFPEDASQATAHVSYTVQAFLQRPEPNNPVPRWFYDSIKDAPVDVMQQCQFFDSQFVVYAREDALAQQQKDVQLLLALEQDESLTTNYFAPSNLQTNVVNQQRSPAASTTPPPIPNSPLPNSGTNSSIHSSHHSVASSPAASAASSRAVSPAAAAAASLARTPSPALSEQLELTGVLTQPKISLTQLNRQYPGTKELIVLTTLCIKFQSDSALHEELQHLIALYIEKKGSLYSAALRQHNLKYRLRGKELGLHAIPTMFTNNQSYYLSLFPDPNNRVGLCTAKISADLQKLLNKAAEGAPENLLRTLFDQAMADAPADIKALLPEDLR